MFLKTQMSKYTFSTLYMYMHVYCKLLNEIIDIAKVNVTINYFEMCQSITQQNVDYSYYEKVQR